MFAISDAQSVAIIGGAFGLASIILTALTAFWVNKGNKDNARDHGLVQTKLDSMTSNMQEVKVDILDIKMDVKHLDEEIGALKEDFSGHVHEHDNRTDGKAGKQRKNKAKV